jgi:two-component system response regulator PilR (NtrC family)
MALGRILVVDDEDSMCQYLSILLQKEGYEVATANGGADALRILEARPVDVVMTDIQMPKMDGIQLLKGIKAMDPSMPVIIMTAYASEQSAIDAVNLGAFSYLQKHCKNDEIKIVVRNALQLRQARTENAQLKKELTKNRTRKQIIGQSPRMRSVYKMVDKIAASAATVLINGESGTGKELIAQAIHQGSDRADKPFVAINCGAIPETLLESQLFGHVKGSYTGADRDHDGFCRQAEGGTIFLDEIGETPHAIQVKLLRMLQEREIYPVGSSCPVKVDLRVIAATNRDLEEEIARGNFRTDLFYRLNVIPLHLPALRERFEVIPLLVDHFL